MSLTADIAVYSAESQLVLLVEVSTKNKIGLSSEWAAKMRSNIFAHGLLPKTPYFLLAFPERFYLWKDANISSDIIMPNYDIDATLFLQHYYDKANISPETIGKQSVEVIVCSWLHEIMILDDLPEMIKQNQKWLIESGLFNAIKRGRVVLPVPV